jgi:hypothetical protein
MFAINEKNKEHQALIKSLNVKAFTNYIYENHTLLNLCTSV